MAVANRVGIGWLACHVHQFHKHRVLTQSTICRKFRQSRARQLRWCVWVRGVGGHLSGSTTQRRETSILGRLNGGITCNTRTLEDSRRSGRHRVARLNLNGWICTLARTVGYMGSRTRDATPGLDPPASFRDSLQIPFVGFYAAASYGGSRRRAGFAEISSRTKPTTTPTDCQGSFSTRAASVLPGTSLTIIISAVIGSSNRLLDSSGQEPASIR